MSLISHERAVDIGLSTQSLDSWLWDVARSAGITALLTAGGAALLIALVRRFPRHWWIPGAAVATGLAIVFVWIAPVVLAPIFNKFEALPEGSQARADVLELGREAGVEIGEVYRIDASRRVTSLNAFVDGIGSSKRVVLYDNLLREAERPQLRSVVAHELGHVANDDIRRGLTYVAIVAPFGLLFVREFALAMARRQDIDPTRPAAVPIYLLAITLTVFVAQHSRQPALAPGRGVGRPVRARAHPRPEGARRAAGRARASEHLRPRPAGLVRGAVRHAPDHGAADRGGAGERTGTALDAALANDKHRA